MAREVTEAAFLKDIADHKMQIIRDDGLYRHVRFAQPETLCEHFDLITWPGYLCYTGDMGTFVFSRLPDMFEFFRTDRAYAQRRGRQLFINLRYWAEKLEAVDSHGSRVEGVKEYSPERFERVIKEQLIRWWREYGLSPDQRHELREAIEGDVLSWSDDGAVRAFDAANNFRHKIDGQLFEFADFWEHDLTDYTRRFVWCCYALAWGIQQYHDAKAPHPAGEQ